MKLSKDDIKFKASKGERLKWTSLKEIKPVVLTKEITKGKLLNCNDLSNNEKSNPHNNVLVP